MKNILLTLIIAILADLTLAQEGAITNVNASQRTDGSMIIDIDYDLDGPEPAYNIITEVSFNAGASFTVFNSVSGDAGTGVMTGTGKHIVWDFGSEFPGYFSNEMQVRITASLSAQWHCGDTLTLIHVAGDIAPVDKTVNYGTVQTNLTGLEKCWITQNLGSDHQASSATDATEASAGWYWQFNRKQGYRHDGTTRTPNTPWIGSISEGSDWQVVNDPCALLLGSGWRLPTQSEWSNARANGGWANRNDIYASVLKMHAAGRIYNSLSGRGTYGYYWSSNQMENGAYAYFLYFSGATLSGQNNSKSYGFSGRCLRDIQTEWSCGQPLSVSHTVDGVAPLNKIVNYSTVLTDLSGNEKCWITQNLGAESEATSATDNFYTRYCWYWQFNQKQGYYVSATPIRIPNTPWITTISENSVWLIENDPCALLLGTGWRLPTSTEWTNTESNGGWNNYNDAYASALKLHAAGYLDWTYNGAIKNRGSLGYYWSSTQHSNPDGFSLHINSSESYIGAFNKAHGLSVRCIKD